MDTFGDNFVMEPEVDPAAEFLAREQNELAGLEVEIPPITNVPPTSNDDGKNTDLFLENFESNKQYLLENILNC